MQRDGNGEEREIKRELNKGGEGELINKRNNGRKVKERKWKTVGDWKRGEECKYKCGKRVKEEGRQNWRNDKEIEKRR